MLFSSTLFKTVVQNSYFQLLTITMNVAANKSISKVLLGWCKLSYWRIFVFGNL